MKNSDGPLISIIIHSFDRFEYLLNAIESIKNQTYKNYELILINDDSNEKEYWLYYKLSKSKWAEIKSERKNKAINEAYSYYKLSFTVRSVNN